MRLVLLLTIAGCLAACDSSQPPPGELIGAFRFVATLDPTPGEGRCLFSGAPAHLAFEGILSHDPGDQKLWLTTDSVRREGTLGGAHFSTRTPSSGPGISRQLSTCSCQMEIAEVVEGDIKAAKDCEGAIAASVGASVQDCPKTLPDGTLSWSDCGCVKGIVREEIEFPFNPPASVDEEAACTCAVEGGQQPAPKSCEIVYVLEGTLM